MDSGVANYNWFNMVNDAISLGRQETEEDFLAAGDMRLSAECWGIGDKKFSDAVRDDPHRIIRYAELLPPHLFDYWAAAAFLAVNQTRMGRFFGVDQSAVSAQTLHTEHVLGYFILCGGYPTTGQLRSSLRHVKMPEDDITFLLAWFDTKERRRVQRLNAIVRSIVPLDREGMGLKEFLAMVLRETWGGVEGRKTRASKGVPEYRVDPEYLGEFRMKLEEVDLSEIFGSTSRYSALDEGNTDVV